MVSSSLLVWAFCWAACLRLSARRMRRSQHAILVAGIWNCGGTRSFNSEGTYVTCWSSRLSCPTPSRTSTESLLHLQFYIHLIFSTCFFSKLSYKDWVGSMLFGQGQKVASVYSVFGRVHTWLVSTYCQERLYFGPVASFWIRGSTDAWYWSTSSSLAFNPAINHQMDQHAS